MGPMLAGRTFVSVALKLPWLPTIASTNVTRPKRPATWAKIGSPGVKPLPVTLIVAPDFEEADT